MRYVCAAVVTAFLSSATIGQAVFVDTELDVPLSEGAGIMFAPDGLGFLWEKPGRVWLLEDGERSAQPLINISEEVGNWVDHGLLGFTIDPNFATNGHVYLMYIVDYYHLMHFGEPGYNPNLSETYTDTIGRIVRYTCDPQTNFTTVIPGSRVVLVGETASTGIAICNQSHGVGTLAFGEDGSLLVSCGDGASFVSVDSGGPQQGSTYTALADGIIRPKENIGAYRAQLVDTHSGKILRIDPATGDGLSSNPFFDPLAPRAPRSRVWALGLRNPFRFSVRPGSGSPTFPGLLAIGDVGWFDWEELNVCTQPGQNFGWPIYEGLDLSTRYTSQGPFNLDAPNPLFGQSGCAEEFFRFRPLLAQDTLAAPSFPNPCDAQEQIPATSPRFVHRRARLAWYHTAPIASAPTFSGNNAATSTLGSPTCPVAGAPFGGACSVGGVWYSGNAYPPNYEGTYFHADFSNGWIQNFIFDAQGELLEVRPVVEDVGLIVCMAINPADGKIYYVRYDYSGGSHVHRLDALPDAAPVASASAQPPFGPLPLTVDFSSAGSNDPQGQPLTYLWDFGDGQTSTDPAPTHVFSGPPGPTRFDVSLTVTDPVGNSHTTVIHVWGDNSPPTITLTAPTSTNILFHPAVPHDFDLAATVADLESPGLVTCEWTILLHHDEHIHPQPPIPSCTGSIHVESHGNDQDVYFYEAILTATDPQGLSSAIAITFTPGCPADLDDDGGGDPNPGGGVDLNDLLFFLNAYEAGSPFADLDDGTGSGIPGDGVDINDLLYFLNHFEIGC